MHFILTENTGKIHSVFSSLNSSVFSRVSPCTIVRVSVKYLMCWKSSFLCYVSIHLSHCILEKTSFSQFHFLFCRSAFIHSLLNLPVDTFFLCKRRLVYRTNKNHSTSGFGSAAKYLTGNLENNRILFLTFDSSEKIWIKSGTNSVVQKILIEKFLEFLRVLCWEYNKIHTMNCICALNPNEWKKLQLNHQPFNK